VAQAREARTWVANRATNAARSAGCTSETQPSADRSNVASIPKIASRPIELTQLQYGILSEYEPTRATRSIASRLLHCARGVAEAVPYGRGFGRCGGCLA